MYIRRGGDAHELGPPDPKHWKGIQAVPSQEKSSGVEEADDMSQWGIDEESDGEKTNENEREGLGGEVSDAVVRVHRTKKYMNSPEFLELQEMSKQKGITLYRIPPIAGAGVRRHPSGSFWSCRYSESSGWATASWGNGALSPLQCLLKMLRHLAREHVLNAPSDVESWKAYLALLEAA